MIISTHSIRLRNFCHLSLVCFLALSGVAYSENLSYEVTIEKGVPNVMRDGIRLFSNIYRPDAEGKFPAILIRTPYNKDRYGTDYSPFPVHAAQKGYVVIIQDVRGRYSSKGAFLPYVQETADGYDAVEWAAALPYVDGKVGMYGCSYLGAVQWLAAIADPPHLKAIFPQCTFANGRHFFYFGGTFDLSWIGWLYDRLPDLKRHRNPEENLTMRTEDSPSWETNKWRWLKHLPLKDFPLLKEFCPYYYEWIAHPDDGSFWDFANIEKSHKNVSVPAYNLTGWFDDGYSQNISPPLSGVIRARYHESESEPSLLTPGHIYKFNIGLMFTSHVFKKGHRLRVSISSSYFPLIDRNPNTGHPFGTDSEWMCAKQTIFHDDKHPSRIILSVIPR